VITIHPDDAWDYDSEEWMPERDDACMWIRIKRREERDEMREGQVERERGMAERREIGGGGREEMKKGREKKGEKEFSPSKRA
jgi:hypothetical protein